MRFFSQLNWHPDSSIHNLGDPPQVLLRRAAEVDGGDVRHGIALGLSHEEEVQGDALVSQRLDVHDGAEEVLAEAVVQQDLPLGTERGSYQLADTLFSRYLNSTRTFLRKTDRNGLNFATDGNIIP